MAGAPLGNQNAKKAKLFESALKRALARAHGSVDAGLDVICDKIVAEALADQNIRRDIADRIDGRPAQSVAVSGDEDSPLVTRIELVPLSANGKG